MKNKANVEEKEKEDKDKKEGTNMYMYLYITRPVYNQSCSLISFFCISYRFLCQNISCILKLVGR